MKKIWRNINIIEKILILLTIIITAKAICDKFLNFNNILGININFCLCSLFINLILWDIIIRIFKLTNIKLSKKEKIIALLLLIISITLCSYNIINRQFLYYQDYTVYYQLQTGLESAFLENNMIGVAKYIIHSIWYNDYNNFICLFIELAYQFTNKSLDSFVISEIIIIMPLLYISILGLIKTIFKENDKISIFLLFISFISPLLYTNIILGMPDVMGIVFINLIIMLTIDYDFKEKDILRLIILGLITLMLIISRRWYMYWVLSYYILYIIKLLLTPIINKDYKSFKIILENGLKFALIYGPILTIILFPMFKRILLTNYSKNYSFYKKGGILYELYSQVKRFGLITILLSFLGYFSLLKKNNLKHRKYLIIFINFFLIIFLFNEVQTFSDHHSLMLFTSIFVGIMLLIQNINSFNKFKYPYLIFIALLLIVNFAYSINSNLKDNIFFTNIEISRKKRIDTDKIKELSDYIYKNTNDDNTAYMIAHSGIYNPDIFRYANTPNIINHNALPYGSAILGSHKFPIQLFSAKYIITCTPFTGYSISQKYNKAFLESPYFNRFRLVKRFDMENEYTFYVYERINNVDLEEINYYLKYFEKENKKYPYLYEDIIKEYIKTNF